MRPKVFSQETLQNGPTRRRWEGLERPLFEMPPTPATGCQQPHYRKWHLPHAQNHHQFRFFHRIDHGIRVPTHGGVGTRLLSVIQEPTTSGSIHPQPWQWWQYPSQSGQQASREPPFLFLQRQQHSAFCQPSGGGNRQQQQQWQYWRECQSASDAWQFLPGPQSFRWTSSSTNAHPGQKRTLSV